MLIYILKRILYVAARGVRRQHRLLPAGAHRAGRSADAVLPTDATAAHAGRDARSSTASTSRCRSSTASGCWKVVAGRSRQLDRHAAGRSLSEVGRAVGNTLMLAVLATLIGFTFGRFFGFVAGYFRDTLARQASPPSLSVLGVSVPHYWLGMVLVIIFSVQLGWLPPTGAGRAAPATGGRTGSTCATSSCRRSRCRSSRWASSRAPCARWSPTSSPGIRAGAARQGPRRMAACSATS